MSRPLHHRRSAALPAALLAVGLLLAGCGDESPDDVGAAPSAAASQDATFPVDVLSGPLSGGQPVTIEARPTKVVSLSPSATEGLWAVGADEQVVAVDDQSDHPEGVPTTKLSGLTPNVLSKMRGKARSAAS